MKKSLAAVAATGIALSLSLTACGSGSVDGSKSSASGDSSLTQVKIGLFPSSAATMSAAARTYLDARDSATSNLYGIMEKQVDTGMIYSGLELPSDIKAGAYLGYLVGNYYLTSHGYQSSDSASASATPAAG